MLAVWEDAELCWFASALKPPGSFSKTFFRTLLNLTWLYTEASWNLLRNLFWNPVKRDLTLHQKPPRPPLELSPLLRNLLRNPVEAEFALREGFVEPPPEPFPEPYWTWPGSQPNLVEPALVYTGAILGWRPY